MGRCAYHGGEISPHLMIAGMQQFRGIAVFETSKEGLKQKALSLISLSQPSMPLFKIKSSIAIKPFRAEAYPPSIQRNLWQRAYVQESLRGSPPPPNLAEKAYSATCFQFNEPVNHMNPVENEVRSEHESLYRSGTDGQERITQQLLAASKIFSIKGHAYQI